MKRASIIALPLVALTLLGVAPAFGQASSDADDATNEPTVTDPALEAALSELEPEARRLWPASFAGVWLGPGGVGDTVSVAFTEDARHRVEQLAADFPEPQLLEPVTVARSLASLEARQRAMSAQRTLLQTGELVLGNLGDGRYDLNIDVTRNVIVVISENPSPGFESAMKTLYGEDVIVQSRPLPQPACSRLDCRYNLRGGLQVSNSQSSCTNAFSVRSPAGNRHTLTAGHCQGVNWHHPSPVQYGDLKQQQVAGPVDAEHHSVTGSFTAQPWIFKDNNFKQWAIHYESTWEGQAVFDAVCKSGFVTAKKCGVIASKWYAPWYVPGSYNFIQASFCGKSGDSGSPVYKGHRADGIHSGSNYNNDQSCSSQDAQNEDFPVENPYFFSVYGHIQYVQQAFGVTVLHG